MLQFKIKYLFMYFKFYGLFIKLVIYDWMGKVKYFIFLMQEIEVYKKEQEGLVSVN